MKVIVVSLHIAHQPPVHSPILIILGPGGHISSYLKSKYQICKKKTQENASVTWEKPGWEDFIKVAMDSRDISEIDIGVHKKYWESQQANTASS